jgi:hypothetical protein
MSRRENNGSCCTERAKLHTSVPVFIETFTFLDRNANRDVALKTTAGVAQVKVRGLAKVQAVFSFAILAYNLVRIPKLLEAT